MKLLLILFSFLTFTLGAQESKPRFWNKLHLELDYNLLLYSYQWRYTYPTIDPAEFYTRETSLKSSSIGFVYRNNFVNGGLKVNLFNIRMAQPTLGFNALFALKNEHYYFGPFASYGHTFGENDFKAKQCWNVGLEGYIHSFHISASYGQYSDFIPSYYNYNNQPTIATVHKNMNGFNFQLGKSVGLVSPKTKMRKRETNIYFEANIGIIQFHQVTGTESCFTDIGFNVRNRKYKFGIAYESALFSNHFLDFNVGVNLFPEKWPVYLGPYLKNGFVLSEFMNSDEKRFAEFGFEAYFKNIHLTGGFARFYRAKHPYETYELTSLNLMLGYALPLGKRVKEN